MHARDNRSRYNYPNRISMYKEVGPSKRYSLRSRNSAVAVYDSWNSDDDTMSSMPIIANRQVSGIGTAAQRDSRRFHAKDNFKIWTDGERSYDTGIGQKSTSKPDSDVFDFKSHHEMALVENPLNRITTLGNCLVCVKKKKEKVESKDKDQAFETSVLPNSTTTETSSVMSLPITDTDDDDDANCSRTTISTTKSTTSTSSLTLSLSQKSMCSCAPYVIDIFNYLLSREKKDRPRSNYITKQSEVTQHMRSVLIDWISDIVGEYNLQRETFFLTVSLLDRTLTTLDCPRQKFQLLGSTVLLISAKFEEIYPPEIKDIVYMAADSFSKELVLNMEKLILKTLNYNVSTPTIENFASILIDWIELSDTAKFLAWYLMDLSTLDYEMISHRPSHLAASAVFLARFMVDDKYPCIPEQINVKIEDLHEPAKALITAFHRASTDDLKSIFNKYSDSNYNKVAEMSLPLNVPPIFCKSMDAKPGQ